MDLGIANQAFIIFGGHARDGARRRIGTRRRRRGSVALVGRDAARAAEAAADLSSRHEVEVVGIAADLTVEGEADRVVAEAVAQLGPVCGAAVTTGLGARGQRDLLGASDDDWAATFDDILMGTVRACRAVVTELNRVGEGGAIVTTAAYSIRAPKAHQFPYAALKSSVATMTKALATTYGDRGIRANCVCPGATETDILASMRPRWRPSGAGPSRKRSSGPCVRTGTWTSR